MDSSIPTLGWILLWTSMIVIAGWTELVHVFRDRVPLTEVWRYLVLNSPVGSALTGGFLTWLTWHWLFDSQGLDYIDLLVPVAGMALGLLGYRKRNINHGWKDSWKRVLHEVRIRWRRLRGTDQDSV